MSNRLEFLRRDRVSGAQAGLLQDRLEMSSRSGIGRRLGVNPGKGMERLPLTSYSFYAEHYNGPSGELAYPIQSYDRVLTSGSMGRPKWFLIPRELTAEAARLTFAALVETISHDGRSVRFQDGDTFYGLFAPKPFGTGFFYDAVQSELSGVVNAVPDQGLSFPEKVAYLMANWQKIQLAAIPVLVLKEILQRARIPLRLKGFVAADACLETMRGELEGMLGATPTTMYASTETSICAVSSVQHYLGIIFDWRTVYFEFIPEAHAITSDQPTMDGSNAIPMNEVRPGETYQMVVTPFKSDLVRYVTSDMVTCVARGDDILGSSLPVFRFSKRVGGMISLHNFTRIDEGELIRVLSESGVAYTEFTARRELRDAREMLVIYLETKGDEKREEVERSIHDTLMRLDNDYSSLNKLMRYNPLEVKLLPSGSFSRYLSKKSGVIKQVERLGMSEANLRLLAEG